MQPEFWFEKLSDEVDLALLRQQIDDFVAHNRDQCVIQDNNNDFRIFHADKKLGLQAKCLFDIHRSIYFSCFNKVPDYCFLMLAKLQPSKNSLGSGDGWHRDTWGRNYKIFTYLSDCLETDDGTFQICRNSSRLMNKTFVLMRDGKGRRYKDSIAGGISNVAGKAGCTFVAKTDTIHRGAPVKTKPRYMATFYNYSGSRKFIEKKRVEYANK